MGRKAPDRQRACIAAERQAVQMLNVIADGVGAGSPDRQLPDLSKADGHPAHFNLDGLACRLTEVEPDLYRITHLRKTWPSQVCGNALQTSQNNFKNNFRALKEIGADDRQDGEMGHEPSPAANNSSQRKKAEQTPLRIGVMASGSGTNFEALAQAILRGDLNADIRLLVVNNPGCGAQRRAERLGIDVDVLDHRVHQDREALDRQLLSRFQTAAVEVVVMAGWMRIVTDGLIEGFPGRLLNIHPSLLPSFRGLDAVGQALAAGVKISGCTVHLVTSELDSGPIVAQAAVPVLETDDPATLRRRIQAEEHKLLPLALTTLMPRWRQG